MHELACAVAPPNLAGLNRLAQGLDEMKRGGAISDWHLGRWLDDTKASYVVLFDTEPTPRLLRSSLAKNR